jgi:hypothetical protein
MTRLAILVPLVVSVGVVAPSVGQAPMPHFDAEALSGRKVAIPAAVQGHPALLVVGFTHGSGPHCTDWAKRLETEFKNSTGLERYTVVFLEDAPRLVRGMAKSGIKSGVPKEQYDRFLIVTEHEKEVKEAVRFQAPDDAYLALLGADGAVRWTFHGAVGDDPVRQIRELLK